MLALKIISTVFISLSVVTAIIKNAAVCEVIDCNRLDILEMSFYSLLWRVFLIVTIWVV